MQRKGYGSIVDVSACRPDLLGDLGGGKGALLAENVSDPYTFSVTSQIAVTGALALLVIGIVIVYGFLSWWRSY